MPLTTNEQLVVFRKQEWDDELYEDVAIYTGPMTTATREFDHWMHLVEIEFIRVQTAASPDHTLGCFLWDRAPLFVDWLVKESPHTWKRVRYAVVGL
jgi:hypothetical protein